MSHFSSSTAKVQDTKMPLGATPAGWARAVKMQEGSVKGGFCNSSNIPKLLRWFLQAWCFSEHCQDKQTRPPKSVAPSQPQNNTQQGSGVSTASLSPTSKPWSARRDFYFPKLPWDHLDNLAAQEFYHMLKHQIQAELFTV